MKEEEKIIKNTIKRTKEYDRTLSPYACKTSECQKLRKEENKIYIITARDESGMPPEYYGKMQILTKEWLKNQNIEFDKLIFAKDSEKLNYCIENNIDIMIEDSPSNIKDISTKIKVIKFDCQYNKEINEKNIITAYSWYHIYDIINKLKNI